MKSLKSVLIALILTAILAAPSAFASTLYTDLTSFLNDAVTNVIDFEENASGDFTSYGTGPANFSGIDFFGSSGLFTVDPNFDASFYEWGSGDVLIDSFGTGLISASFPGGFTAIAADIMSFDPEAAGHTITLSTGEVFNIGTASRPTRTFVGFISDVPLTSISFQVQIGNNPAIDNFRFGSKLVVSPDPSGTAVPEPLTLFMTGFGLLGFAGLRRFKS